MERTLANDLNELNGEKVKIWERKSGGKGCF
ncbi:MAG: hypothetical protein CEN91_64 [Candidatus Berkelbacteria bacterium Licking1014_85]|uniref:Uncharacterized protein n=1 Tax=Candidatus Berkelbacteria bacterium Licking1014_85 TaxID=2017148 RepID=A0A554LM42_9BACT|nr:MAG: hypothetical protein CEN91_64 [Candidatus Berkelbacteria bacterium Licking1014_85]